MYLKFDIQSKYNISLVSAIIRDLTVIWQIFIFKTRKITYDFGWVSMFTCESLKKICVYASNEISKHIQKRIPQQWIKNIVILRANYWAPTKMEETSMKNL